MPLIPCPQCHKGVQVPVGSAGKKARCAACGGQFLVQIPGQGRASAAAPPRELADYLPLLVVLGGSAMLLLAIVAGVGWWLFVPGGNVPARAGAGAAAVGRNAAPLAAADADASLSREPKAGPLSWIAAPPLKGAEKQTWKVTAENLAPAPPDLASLFPFVDMSPGRVAFSSPEAARAAIVQMVERNLVWVQYDLRQPTPLATVSIGKNWEWNTDSALPEVALSPSGQQLAVPQLVLPFPIKVWSADGQEVCTVSPPDLSWEAPLRRVYFAGESRLLVDGGGSLRAYALPSGEELYRLPAPPATVPLVSPGGAWLAQVGRAGVDWFSTADGSPAGRIELGEHWHIPQRDDVPLSRLNPHLVFEPSGNAAALFARNAQSDMLIAHWDLATGEPIEQFVIPAKLHEGQLPATAIWCGERKLLFSSGNVVDFDYRTWTCRYQVDDVGHSPDGRCWRLVMLQREQLPAVAQKLGVAELSVPRALAAVTLPDERVSQQLAAAREGLLLYPGCRLAVVIEGEVVSESRQEFAAILADSLAERGFQVDAAAPTRLRVMKARRIPFRVTTAAGREQQAAEAQAEFVDGQGRQLLELRQAGVQMEGSIAECWKALAEKLLEDLPRFALRDAAGIDPSAGGAALEAGVDGIFDPGEVRPSLYDLQ